MKKHHNNHRSGLINAIAAIGVLCSGLTARGDDNTRQQQVEAAFIYNFTQFIEWPADAFSGDGAPFVIGIVGDDAFDGLLAKAMAGKKVGSHPVQVAYFHAASDVGPVALLVVPPDEDDRMADMLSRLGSTPTLTIGNTDSFLAANGGIRLYTEDRKMRFQINLRATDHARLKISSKLLNLAKIYGS